MYTTANLYGLVKAAAMQEGGKKKKKKSWISRHPLLAAAGLAGLGYGGYKGYKYIKDGEAAEDLAGMKNWIGESALGKSSLGKSLGLDKWVDFDHNRMDKSLFNANHAPGSLPKSFMREVASKGKVVTNAPTMISQKTGMGKDEAKSYIDNVRKFRNRAETENKVNGRLNVMPADKISVYNDAGDMAEDMGAKGVEKYIVKKMIQMGGPSTLAPYMKRSGKETNIDSMIYAPEDFRANITGSYSDKLNGLYNKNLKGDASKFFNMEQITGHEGSHATNWPHPSSGYGENYIAREGRDSYLADRTNAPTMDTKAMRRLTRAMENGDVGSTDYTYPLHGYPEVTQNLASMKQLAIALNGGRVPQSEAGWRKAFEYIANSDPQSLEQYRFQSYITPQSVTKHVADIYRNQNIKKITDALLKEDGNGVSAMDQLAFRASLGGSSFWERLYNFLYGGNKAGVGVMGNVEDVENPLAVALAQRTQ